MKSSASELGLKTFEFTGRDNAAHCTCELANYFVRCNFKLIKKYDILYLNWFGNQFNKVLTSLSW